MRAFVNNITHSSARQGGSTITQQYIKNTFLSSEKSYIRKLKELILAVQLEQAYDKKKILELYLNKIPYGNNAFGVEKASQIYFNKHAKDLDLAEASVLASLPKAPSHYNPYGQYKYTILKKTFTPEEIKIRNITKESDLQQNEFRRGLIGKTYKLDDTHSVYLQGRTDIVLKTMQKQGYITEEEKNKAIEELHNLKFNKYKEDIKAPHFVFYILSELENKYGKEIVEQGGLQVYTTIDPHLQDLAEKAIQEGVEKNTKKYNAKNGAMTVIDPKTGEILAMVGSKDYFDKEIDGAVNITTSYKQPGSTFKPFVYAKAFYNRYSPGSIIFDVPTRFGASAYPKNYDGKFLGPITMRKALAQSRNIPAIKAYFLAGEQKEIIPFAEKVGLKFLSTDRDYGWPLALGTAEVRQIDLANAYATFANGGKKHEIKSILKIQNSKGEILEELKEDKIQSTQAVDPQIAYLINNILSDDSVKLGDYEKINGHTVATKTGTSNRKLKGNKYLPHDLWIIGYTPDLSVAIWTGNTKDDEENNIGSYASGYTASGPILHKFLTEALKDKPDTKFNIPDEITHETISKLTGKLPGPNTPENQLITEVFASFAVPTEIDNSTQTALIDTRNNKLANQYCPPKFVKEQTFINIPTIAPYETWEEGAKKWMEENMGEEIEGSILGLPPTEESELCTQDFANKKPEIKILNPKNNDTVEVGATLKIKVKIKAENGVDKVEYYMDGTYQYENTEAPYEGQIRLPKAEFGSNSHKIKVIAYDKYGYKAEKEITIKTSKDKTQENKNPTTNKNKTDKNDQATI